MAKIKVKIKKSLDERVVNAKRVIKHIRNAKQKKCLAETYRNCVKGRRTTRKRELTDRNTIKKRNSKSNEEKGHAG